MAASTPPFSARLSAPLRLLTLTWQLLLLAEVQAQSESFCRRAKQSVLVKDVLFDEVRLPLGPSALAPSVTGLHRGQDCSPALIAAPTLS